MDPVSATITLTDVSGKKKRPVDLEAQDPGSILSGGVEGSKDSIDEDKGVTFMDIKMIMPTVLILLFTLLIMVTVIPYAFSSVIKQLQAVWALQESAALEEAKSALDSTERIEPSADSTGCTC